MIARNVLGLCACVMLAPAAQAIWPRHTIDESSEGADGVRLADVNGDGLMDIAVGWEEGGVVRAYLHPGRGAEKEKWPAVTVGEVNSPEDAVFADLDGDGAVDVVSSCEGKTKTIFVHWAPKGEAGYLAAAGWTTEAIPATEGAQAWMYALPMQVDGVHGIDLIAGSKGENGSVGWLQAPRDGRDLKRWKWHKLEDAGWIMSLIAADMDGDGDEDVLVSDRKGRQCGVYWLEYPGAEEASKGGSWKRHEIGGAERELLFLSRGDLDGDGKEDVIAIDKAAVVWFRAGPQGWSEHVIPLPAGVGNGKSAAVGDVDGDGRNDVVFSCEGAEGALSGMRWLSWTKSATEGPWESHEVGGPEGLKYDRVVLHDVDGDGDLDVLCCEERDQLGVFWYENPHGAKDQAPEGTAPRQASGDRASSPAVEAGGLPSRIAFGSCARQDHPLPILGQVVAASPDLFVFLGDNVYGDTEDMEELEAKYAVLGAKAEFQALRAAAAIEAIWDDHDYGANDAGSEYPRKEESKEVFLDFWKVPADSERRGRPGIYGSRRWEHDRKVLQLILLDTRTFRDPLARNGKPAESPFKNDYHPDPDPTRSLLGEAQWKWLSQQFREPADLRIVASSIQFGHEYNGWESWTNLPAEHRKMIELIKATRANGVVFISGDVHWGELSVREVEDAYPLYDVTSSALNQTWPTIEANQFRVGEPEPGHNFGMIVVDWDKDDPAVSLQLRNEAGETSVEKSVRLSELRFPETE